jgi:hypothetical protein
LRANDQEVKAKCQEEMVQDLQVKAQEQEEAEVPEVPELADKQELDVWAEWEEQRQGQDQADNVFAHPAVQKFHIR